MNVPNILTILRVILVPFVVVLLLVQPFEYSNYLALGIFGIACLTDMLDGMIARKYNLITNFGKFMDPLADKLLVCSCMICFTATGYLPAWITIIIIAREFIISGFRLIAADKGVVIAAGKLGKIKTVTQMIMLIILILDFKNSIFYSDINVALVFIIVEKVFIYLAAIFTIISLIEYLVKNKDVLKDTK